MVVSRIRAHVATHNWFAVGVDLAIVVAGVFLGMQVSNWNESRIERDQSQAYRARLIDELDFNERQYRQQLAYYSGVRDHGLALLAALDASKPISDRDLLIHAYQSTQVDLVAAKRFIYDELVSAGLVDRLGSDATQALVGDYYLTNAARERTLNEIPEYRRMMRSIMPYEAQRRIRYGCGDIPVRHQGRIIGVRLPVACDEEIPAAVAAAGADRIRSDPAIGDALTRYIGSLDEKLDSLRTAAAETAELQALLVDADRRS